MTDADQENLLANTSATRYSAKGKLLLAEVLLCCLCFLLGATSFLIRDGWEKISAGVATGLAWSVAKELSKAWPPKVVHLGQLGTELALFVVLVMDAVKSGG